MENGLKSLRELFDGTKVFKIPMYQRAYSWTEKQLGDFIEDILNQKPDRTYFFGTILLEKAEEESDFDYYKICFYTQREATETQSDLKIFNIICNNSKITIDEIIKETKLSRSGIKKIINKLKSDGKIKRIGPDKGGHWEVKKWLTFQKT